MRNLCRFFALGRWSKRPTGRKGLFRWENKPRNAGEPRGLSSRHFATDLLGVSVRSASPTKR